MTPVLSWPSSFRLKDEVQYSIVTCYACSTKLTIDFDGFLACMICLETLFSDYTRAIPKSFGIPLGIWCLLAVNVANCMERFGCQQNWVRGSSGEIAKAFLSECPWGVEDTFPQHTILLCFTVISNLWLVLWPPHCPSSDKWDHLSLAVLTQTWCTGLSLDHARCHHIRFYSCPAANSHFAAIYLFHLMKQLRNYL